MYSEKSKSIFIHIILIFLFPAVVFAQNTEEEKNEASLEKGIQILQKYILENNNWHMSDAQLRKQVMGLVHFIEDEPIDSTLYQLQKFTRDSASQFVFRLPENVADSLSVPGFYSSESLKADFEQLGFELQQKFQNEELAVPVNLLTDLEKKVDVIPPGKGIRLFADSIYSFPENLIIPEVIPDSLLQNPEEFSKLLKTDSIRTVYIEQKRLEYNEALVAVYRDSVINQYRQDKFESEYNVLKRNLTDSVKINNYNVLKEYNDTEMKAVNDSIFSVIQVLANYADFIDSSDIEIQNLLNEPFTIKLSNHNNYFNRIWLKNEQNDSLRVLVKNLDKRTVQMLIDDGVTFSRFKPKETKKFDFSTLNETVSDLNNVGKQYEIETPWKLGGDGTLGFTQTYLENWKKGGQSALSLLMVLKGTANYSRADGKVKWENTAEIRNGWIKPGGENSELQKNDDKFELTTRYGLSAFKKWYYSAELNYETQIFRGYTYPTSENPEPISAFMAPARTFIKLGLNYKPNQDFSLLLSPLTIKNVYVRDTLLIDQTKFGVEAGRKSFWEPGLNADVSFKKLLTKDITYETKYKMFINYKEPFRKFDINWENKVVMKLTDYINMQMMLHLIYDDDVLFPVYDDNDVKIGEEPKLQLKQLITVGFSYKINRNVMRTKRVR